MAATGKPQGMAVAGCNYVAQDQIWKSHVDHEKVAAKDWPENWNFLTTKYEDLVKDDFPEREKVKRDIPTPLRIPPVTPIEKYIKVGPSPKPFPATTSRVIGWRSTEKEHMLEKYGRYCKSKGGLVKQLGWPQEGVD
ncbi:unnamed protein product [Owenia fusiformis]|uniref:Uncharacterized protein n=1 Tax=Owenia fusiformis TaxID=6347 RepID=A0A8S4NGJ5_OWEFU|nr:unnamed protein product [Owenia fusiformis]